MTQLNNLHILIAEDDPDDGEIITQRFAEHAAFTKVEWVKNGKELLSFLNNTHNSRPDIILTDINMPILNGIEALQEIYKDLRLRNIPVFVYSSTINPIYEAKSKELGAKAFLTKPFDLFEFDKIPVQIISTLIKETAPAL